MEMKDEVTFPLILCSYKRIKTMQISLGREIYKAVGRIMLFVVFFVSYLVLLAFIFLLMPLPWLVSRPRALTSAPPVLCLVC